MKPALTILLAVALWLGASTVFAGEKAPSAPGFKPYPLDTCLVGGEKLGGMGQPFVFKFEGREIKFCCKGCITDFKKDSGKFMARLAEADKNAPAKPKDSPPAPPKP